MAVRFEVRKPHKAFGGGLIVERGQAVVLSLAGGATATLQPGPYRFDDAILRDLVSLGAPGRMILTFLTTGDIDLHYTFEDLLTKDHLPVSGSGLLVVRVARPALFLASVVRGRLRYTERDLCQALSRPVADAMADFLSRMSAFDLDSGPQIRQKLATVLEQHLGSTLDGQGLEFVTLRAAQFRQEGVLRERRALGEALLAERRLEIMKRRAATWQRMSELAAQLAAVEARNQQQIADLRRSLAGRAQDQELVREQMREKMSVEHQLELAKLQSELPSRQRAAAASSVTPRQVRYAAQAYARTTGGDERPADPHNLA